MKGIKCIRLKEYSAILLLAFSSVSLALSPLVTSSAKAVSDYDNVIQLSNKVSVKSYTGTCTEADYTTNWSTDIINNDAIMNTSGMGSTQRETMQAYFNENKIEWGISQFQDPSTGQKNLFIWWSEDFYEQALWESPTDFHRLRLKYPSTSSYKSWINVIQDESCNTVVNGYGHQTGAAYWEIATDQTAGIRMIFANTFSPITTPTGYAGILPPTGIANQTIQRPEFKACVRNQTIIIQDKSPNVENATYNYVHYLISQGTFETATNFKEITIPIGTEFDTQMLDSQPFNVQAIYTLESSVSSPDDTPEIDYRETVVSFPNTTDQCQDTEDLECDESDVCTGTTEQKYIDCTQYNWQVNIFDFDFSIPSPETVGCAVNQFWLKLIDLITFIFNPNPEPFQDPFSEWTTDSHGLTSVLTLPIETMTNLANGGYTCTNADLQFPILGNVQLPCMQSVYENMFGLIFYMYQTIASGLISYYVLIRLLEMVKGFKDPQNDRIEVLDL